MTGESIASRILVLRGQRVMLDADLAELYGVPTKVLNQAVKRNSRRFPPDFLFRLNPDEKSQVVTRCDHLARLKYSKALPYAFTEHGAIQVANILNTEQAVEMGIYVVRAFVHLREFVAAHEGLAERLDGLAALLASGQESTRVELRAMVEVLRQLTRPAEQPAKRPIGFVTPDDKPPSAAAGAPAPGRGRKLRDAPGAGGR